MKGNLMSFIDWDSIPPNEVAPGIRIRTPYGKNLMLSRVEFDAGAVVPMHSHPHEQGGMMLEGKMKFTIDGETRIVLPGESFIIPGGVPHRAEAVDGPCVALDIFSPIREDYVELANKYIPSGE
ncbi:MAG: quercetin dioxygenase-like cupin family protein [Candidatus Latescibacterota bacterium]|jgi:quercetin dioxygenase-like cupin family protein